MEVDPTKLPRIYRNAHANLVPNTPLMDMQVNIWPGSPSAGVLPHGGTIPVGETLSPINADELLGALDGDTRTWFTSLVTALSEGTAGRGNDIRALLRNLGPTSEQLRQVGDLLAARRHELASLVHNLGVLNKAASAKDAQIAQVVRAGDTTVRALASQATALQTSVNRLPSTLATTRTTLVDTAAFANALSPTANALVPIARRLPQTLKDTNTLVQGAVLLPLDQIKPFVDAVTPLTTQLPPLESALEAGDATADQLVQGARLRHERARVSPRRQEPWLPVLGRVVRPQRQLVHLELRRERAGVALAPPLDLRRS